MQGRKARFSLNRQFFCGLSGFPQLYVPVVKSGAVDLHCGDVLSQKLHVFLCDAQAVLGVLQFLLQERDGLVYRVLQHDVCAEPQPDVEVLCEVYLCFCEQRLVQLVVELQGALLAVLLGLLQLPAHLQRVLYVGDAHAQLPHGGLLGLEHELVLGQPLLELAEHELELLLLRHERADVLQEGRARYTPRVLLRAVE